MRFAWYATRAASHTGTVGSFLSFSGGNRPPPPRSGTYGSSNLVAVDARPLFFFVFEGFSEELEYHQTKMVDDPQIPCFWVFFFWNGGSRVGTPVTGLLGRWGSLGVVPGSPLWVVTLMPLLQLGSAWGNVFSLAGGTADSILFFFF